jgi:hypothetical protein
VKLSDPGHFPKGQGQNPELEKMKEQDYFSVEGNVSLLPPYLHPQGRGAAALGAISKNLALTSGKTIRELEKCLGIPFEGGGEGGNLCFVGDPEVRLDFRLSFAPLHIGDYILAVLHSQAYHKKYGIPKAGKPFEIPYPKDLDHFWKLVRLGGDLREMHALDGPVEPVKFPAEGSNLVERPRFRDQRAYINKSQYFHPVPKSLWEFSFGGHHPARHWLEHRVGNRLAPGEIVQFQKLLASLSKLIPLVERIDGILAG